MSTQSDPANSESSAAKPDGAVRFTDIKGLGDEKDRFRETILASATAETVDPYQTTSAVIYGSKGSGRRRFVKAAAGELTELGYHYFQVNSLNQRSAMPGEALEEAIYEAERREPAVLVLDCFADLDTQAPFHTLTDKIAQFRNNGSNVVVLVSFSLGDLGRCDLNTLFASFDLCLEIPAPDLPRRTGILQSEFQRVSGEVEALDTSNLDIDVVATEADGFNVIELRTAVRRIVQDARTRNSDEISTARAVRLLREMDDERIEQARAHAAIDSVQTTDLSFDDVAGLSDAKTRLRELLETPLERSEVRETLGLEDPGSILLHGPPGTGKTLLARATANEIDRAFISISASELKNEYGFGVESQLREVFETAKRNAPAVIFFDEFDAIGRERGTDSKVDSVTSTLLTEMDGIGKRGEVAVIAATNRVDVLDDALLRPGRFEFILPITRPSWESQVEIFDLHTKDVSLSPDCDPEWVLEHLEDPTGADIAGVCRHATTGMLQRTDADTPIDELELTRADFEWALDVFDRCRQATTDTEETRMIQ